MLTLDFLVEFPAMFFHNCLLLRVMVNERLLGTSEIKHLVRQLKQVVHLSDVDVVIGDALVSSETRKMLRANLVKYQFNYVSVSPEK